jgi:hypothetical protein
MGKLANVLKAIGRFINRAIIDMTDDRPGGGMAARQQWDEREEIPPDWPRAIRSGADRGACLTPGVRIVRYAFFGDAVAA